MHILPRLLWIHAVKPIANDPQKTFIFHVKLGFLLHFATKRRRDRFTPIDAATGDAVLSCVGAYQLEGLGAQLFSAVEGDYFTVLGMPLLPLLETLRGHGVIVE